MQTTKEDTTPVLVDEKEAARILCLSHKTLRKERALNMRLPYYKLGPRGAIRYKVSDLLEYLEKHRIEVDSD